MSPTNRTQSRFSSPCPLDQRLLAYALGGGALALVAVPAEATPISSGIQNITVASSGPTNPTETLLAVNLVPGDATSPVFNLSWFILNAGADGAAAGVGTVAQNGPGAFAFYNSSIFANKNLPPGRRSVRSRGRISIRSIMCLVSMPRTTRTVIGWLHTSPALP